MSHGLPVPVWVTASVPSPAPQGSSAVLPVSAPGAAGAPKPLAACGAPCASAAVRRTTLAQSMSAVALPKVACVVPVTGSDSCWRENCCSASPPHRLAVVVFHAPPCWRAMKPVTRRGRSSFQAGLSTTVSSRRAALTSPPAISHHH